MALKLDGLADLEEKTKDKKEEILVPSTFGKPALILLVDIEEDIEQPRTLMQEEALLELAESIKEFGVQQAIVVREISSGKFKIVAGHRRFRASKLAGLKEIPSYVDVSNDNPERLLLKQLTENIHREDLSPIDIAKTFERLLGYGIKQKDIAATVKKSKVFVSEHISLLKLPEFLLAANQSGICKSLRNILMLGSLAKNFPEETEAFVKGFEGEINRADIENLQKKLEKPEGGASGPDAGAAKPEGGASGPDAGAAEPEGGASGPDAGAEAAADALLGSSKEEQFKKPTFKVTYEGNDALILMKKKPSSESLVWIKLDYDGTEKEISIDSLTFLRLQEAD